MIGKFITFEGGEGSGKTTIITALVEKLINQKYQVISTREPGGSDIAEQIRRIILDVKNTKMVLETEALLFAASRVQHLNEKVIPALAEGKIVICDRYLDSSLAYQGYARGLGLEDVMMANHFAAKHLPDLTIFIDVKPEIALKRITDRDKQDRLDLETLAFHQRVYDGYLKVREMFPNRVKSINGNQPLEKVIADVINLVQDFLALK